MGEGDYLITHGMMMSRTQVSMQKSSSDFLMNVNFSATDEIPGNFYTVGNHRSRIPKSLVSVKYLALARGVIEYSAMVAMTLYKKNKNKPKTE